MRQVVVNETKQSKSTKSGIGNEIVREDLIDQDTFEQRAEGDREWASGCTDVFQGEESASVKVLNGSTLSTLKESRRLVWWTEWGSGREQEMKSEREWARGRSIPALLHRFEYLRLGAIARL